MFFIQPTVTKITSDTTVNNASGEYWVCIGKTLTVNNSTGSTYYMEDAAVLNVAATTGDQAILKPSCTVNNSSSGDIAITADMTSNITLNNTGSGTITQQTNCPPGNGIDPFAPGVTFGYGGGSFYGGCYAIPLGLESAEAAPFTVYPNPVSEEVLFLQSGTPVVHLIITDLQGKTVAVFDHPENELRIAGLADGAYLLRATMENGEVGTTHFSVQ